MDRDTYWTVTNCTFWDSSLVSQRHQGGETCPATHREVTYSSATESLHEVWQAWKWTDMPWWKPRERWLAFRRSKDCEFPDWWKANTLYTNTSHHRLKTVQQLRLCHESTNRSDPKSALTGHLRANTKECNLHCWLPGLQVQSFALDAREGGK